MAYETSNQPQLVSNRVGGGPAIWMYKDGDPLSTVTAINYIKNAAELGMSAGDLLLHVDETLGVTNQLIVQAGATTGTAVGATTDTAGYAVGATTITLASAGTGSILAGDVIRFGNDPDTEYTVTTGDASVAAGGTIVIPALVTAISAVATPIYIQSNVRNLVVEGSGVKVISGAGTTRTLTQAESGAHVLFDTAAGQTFTLPSCKAGLKFKFHTSVSQTGGAYAIVTASGDFVLGQVSVDVESEATGETYFANGTSHTGVSSNKTTTGGLVGGWIEVEGLTDVIWSIRGCLSATATPATPFTT